MAKRKRDSQSDTPDLVAASSPADGAIKNQKRVCNRCLVDAKKSLVAALRLGAGFERQKHSRRKKTAQAKKDTKSLERLDAEYLVLKGLELEKVADQHLRKTLGRVKSLKDQEALKTYVDSAEKSNTDVAMLNVLARLYKVAAVKKVVDDAIEQLKGVFAPTDTAMPSGDTKERKIRKKAASEHVEMPDVSDEDEDAFNVFSARIAAPSSGGEGSEASVSGGERPPSISYSESEHDPEDHLDAESESDEHGAFQGFTDEDAAINRQRAPPSNVYDSESAPSKAAIPTKNARTKALPLPTSSAFVPALSHATYVAGSDSEASDLSADFAPRKNRRGQRARQKILEAKYGAKAKHIEKQNQAQWDAKRGAVSAKRGYGPQQSGENAIPLGKTKVEKKRDDKGTLHPSWEAAKAAKEKKTIKIDIGKLQGGAKKVVFD
ncbi:hypothetical protein ACEQ8H_008800 [Pleosporales sp. CAS-2024a]